MSGSPAPSIGCGVAQCGACSVHLNGEVVRSCSLPVRNRQAHRQDRHDRSAVGGQLASGAEGVAGDRRAAVRLLPVGPDHGLRRRCWRKNPRPTDKDIDDAMTNICRCGHVSADPHRGAHGGEHDACGKARAGSCAGPREVEGLSEETTMTTNTTKPRTLKSPSRRKFIVTSAAAGGGFALGLNLPLAWAASAPVPGTEINAWVVVRPDDTCVIRIARSEMGQGTLTGLAQLVAEELECDWKKIAYEMPTPGQNLALKRVWGEMGTGGSRGIRTSEDYVRRGGAVARTMLLQAAADEWKVPVGELTVSEGVITHAASNRTTSYGKVAAAAAKLTPPDPKSIKLKDPREWKIAGKPLKRLDTAEKLNGSLVYAIDMKVPGMLCAAVKASPVFGGKLVSYDDKKIAKMPGHQARREGQRQDGRRRRRHVVAREEGARRAADRLGRSRERNAQQRDDRRAPEGRARGAECVCVPQGRRCARRDRRRGEESRSRLQHAVPGARLHGADELHAKITADRGEVWVATQNGEAALARCPRNRDCRWRNARSTSTRWAAGSAAAADRRTTCGRRSRSRSSSRARRSR
jgi:hypothetical protein